MSSRASRFSFSLDPLIAEAKRRMRRRRGLVAAAAIVLVTGAVALAVESSQQPVGSADAAQTQLTVLAVNVDAHLAWHLKCNPPSGNLPDPAGACAAIAADPTLITKPKLRVCGAAFDVTIVGRVNGKPVDAAFGTCLPPQLPLVNKLGLDLSRR